MVFQSTNEEVKVCFPFCCFNTVPPSKLIFLTVVWDVFIWVCWFIYFLVLIDYFTCAPLVITFVLILILFPVVWDIRDPAAKFNVLTYYSIFRIFEAILMTAATLACFVLIFVFVANPSLETSIYSKYHAMALFLFLLPVAFIHWITVSNFQTSLKLMRSMSMNDLTNSRLNLTISKLNHTQQSFRATNVPTNHKLEMMNQMHQINRLTQI